MGFFSDLKDDLSQAVTDVATDEVMEENVAAEETAGSADFEVSDADLDSLLEQIDTSIAQEAASMVDEAPSPVEESEPALEQAPAFTAPSVAMPTTSGRVASDEVSVIMDSMIINGNMATEGSLDLRGSIVGNVECLGKLNITGNIQGNSSAAEVFAEGAKINGEVRSMGPIKIGQSTTIIGNVFATSAVVAGAVKGDIDVKGPVVLDSTAIVLGNIKSKAVQINNGAVIEGLCSQCYAEVNPKSFFEELKKMK